MDRSHKVRTSVNYQLAQPLNPLTIRRYPKQADRENVDEGKREGGRRQEGTVTKNLILSIRDR